MKRFAFLALGYGAAAAGIAALFALVALGFRPPVGTPPAPPAPGVLAAVEASRHVTFDREHPPVIAREVDYAEGADAPWKPRQEAPILAGLVQAGKLPSLAERVGPEPMVLAGVEGIGRYGGTWYRLANSERDVLTTQSLLTTPTLMRWSPQGYPVVPYVAKSLEISDDQRAFTFTLRRGMKWSDGAPFTADDIMFWWEWEVLYFQQTPRFMRIAGQMGTVEKLDDLRVRFRFPLPNPQFLTYAARIADQFDVLTPAHYLRQFHPKLGDPQRVQRLMTSLKLGSPVAVYRRMKEWRNPECPRLSPWIYRRYKPSAPYTFVRNPYFCSVDPAGNQLPYLDRLVIDVKTAPLIPVAAANGELSMQDRHLFYENHTLLLGGMQTGGYRVLHWFPATRSAFTIFPVLNRRIDPAEPDTGKKAALLNDRRFRQALSVAIDREAIIAAVFNGQGEPAQLDGGPLSDFHSPRLFKSFTAHDPAQSNRLLDELGLTHRDAEGFRTFADGSRMTFFLHLSSANVTTEPAQFVVDDWARVGVRVVLRLQGRPLFYAQKAAYEHDFDAWTGDSEFDPLIEPRNFVPTFGESFYAPAYGLWYRYGGLYGDPAADRQKGAIAPPVGHPLRAAMELLDQALTSPSPESRRATFQKIQDIAAENVWSISIATAPPQLVVVKNGFRNVPDHAITGTPYLTPANTGIETYFWDEPGDSPAVIAQTRQELLDLVPMSDLAASGAPGVSGHGRALGQLLRWLTGGAVAAAVLLLGFRHPFIGRRLLLMGPTLAVVSAIVFIVIQLPPGDFVTARITELEFTADASASAQIEDLRTSFHLEDSQFKRYLRWVGVVWFTSFDPRDEGLLQGNLGRSMEYNRPVNDIVGDRILLTLAISVLTILFTWAVALPMGIYAAVRQYSAGDYLLTLLGFLGVSVPSFLCALVLIYLSNQWLGLEVTGLFSSRYATQLDWTWGKFVDLLQHVWVPVLVLGLAGTAGMIRIMRANLLDELRKPYVTAARARGCRPLQLLLKYPVRIALNPFVSGLGSLFPHLLSGGAIIALVLSLPIIGPEMLAALLNEDTYFAGSMLMVLSVLGVCGTLVSDLLLLWIDPRIRLGRSRR